MTGHFFAGRFKGDRLKTDLDVVSCSLYVDLNWIRAGMAETPETSVSTSAYDRIQARWDATMRETRFAEHGYRSPVDWLDPIFHDERSDAYVPSQGNNSDAGADTENTSSNPTGCHPVRSARLSNKGFLSMEWEQCLVLLNRLGRLVRTDKRGSIPADLPPILRLGLDPQAWFDSFLARFHRLSWRHPPPLPFAAAPS